MEKTRFENVKNLFVNFKLDYCCWLAPIRVGLLITGYFNIILAYLFLIGAADGSLSSLVSLVQDQILEDNAKQIIPIVAYATELAFNVVLLCGLYRRDIQLMRMYMRYCIAAVVASMLVYSMVVAAIGTITTIGLVCSIVFQIYSIILVRSMIVEFRQARKNLELPTVVMSTFLKEPVDTKEPTSEPETEAVVVHTPETRDRKEPETRDRKEPESRDRKEPETRDQKEPETRDQNEPETGDPKKPETKLETVDEHPKDESLNEKD